MRGGAASVGMKLAYIGLGLAHTILLARILGPDGYGTFAYVFALVSMLSIPARFGLPNLLVRETAKGQTDGAWDVVHGLWRWSALIACGLSGLLAAASLIVLWFWVDHFTTLQIETFLWGLTLVPLMALSNMTGAALRGLRHVVQGQLPEFVIRPAAFLLLVAASLWLAAPLTAANTMALRTAAGALAFAIGLWLLCRQAPSRSALGTAPRYQTRTWLASTLPLAFTAGMQIINRQTDILMLGAFAPTETVGIYRVAVQGATLVAFGLQAVNMVVAPHFARLYRQGDLKGLQRLVTQSARGIVMLTLPVATVFIVFGEPILRLVFGNEYTPAATPLAILAIGQFASAFFGSVAFLLNMTGHETDTARGVALAAITNIVLNLVLIPTLGANGAAIGTAASLALWNILLAISVTRRIGIRTLAFNLKR